MESETYTRETMLQQSRGGNVILADEERKTPFPHLEIGTRVQFGEVDPKFYTVVDKYLGAEDKEGKPLRQTLVVR
jgi:hypothetical protein